MGWAGSCRQRGTRKLCTVYGMCTWASCCFGIGPSSISQSQAGNCRIICESMFIYPCQHQYLFLSNLKRPLRAMGGQKKKKKGSQWGQVVYTDARGCYGNPSPAYPPVSSLHVCLGDSSEGWKQAFRSVLALRVLPPLYTSPGTTEDHRDKRKQS